MQEKIYIRQWLEMKPYKKQEPTDRYYLRLANKVRQAFAGRNYMILAHYLNKEQVSTLACFLTSWFEDVISQSGIYKAFITMHTKQYGKILPFYDTTDYVEDEINGQDVLFLIWYFLNTMQNEKFISPYNEFIDEIASVVMEVFEQEYEIAYENLFLQEIYTLDYQETDFYHARYLIDTVLFSSYLFHGDTHQGLIEIEAEVIKESAKETNITAILQEHRDWYLHDTRTRLMAASGKEWVAEILGDNHPRSADLRNMSQKIRGLFMYKGQDHANVFLEHIASGKSFNLTKKSFDHAHQLTEPGTLVYIGIVNWRNEWWFTGTFAAKQFSDDMVQREKNSLDSRAMVSFLDHAEHDSESLLHQHAEAFKSYNNGSLIAFMTTDKMTAFTEGFLEYYNRLTDPKRAKSKTTKQKDVSDELFGDREKEFSGLPDTGEPGLVFFNPKAGIEMAYGVNSAFPLPGNPWFDESESEKDILYLLMSKDISTELVYYCIEHCSDRLPYFKQDKGKRLLDDIDFLLRFWKGKEYHSEKRVGYIGAK